MTPDQISSTICRISSGKQYLDTDDTTYIVVQPSQSLLYKAQRLYEKTIYTNRFSKWLTQDQCTHVLISSGLLAPTYKDDIKALHKSLENYKLDLYNNYLQVSKQKKIRKYISLTKESINKTANIAGSLDVFTLHGYAYTIKQEFIFVNTIQTLDGKNVFKSYHDSTSTGLIRIINTIMKKFINDTHYRKIARSNMWKEHWRVSKNNPFPGFDFFTEEQRQILMISQMYDSVYNSSECPPDIVIEDDDMLDGWLIHQRKEIENFKTEKRADTLASKHGNAQEIYVVAHSEEDRKRIDGMNTEQNQMVKKQREASIKKQGTVDDGQLPDNKMENMNKARQAYMDRIKGIKKG